MSKSINRLNQPKITKELKTNTFQNKLLKIIPIIQNKAHLFPTQRVKKK